MSWRRFFLLSLALPVVNQIKPFAGTSPIMTAESSYLEEPWLRHAKYLLLPLPIVGLFEMQEDGVAEARTLEQLILKGVGVSYFYKE